MSARTDLVAALQGPLPASYRVVGAPDVPDLIEPGVVAVRVWAETIAPGPQVGSLQIDLTVWVLTGSLEPGTADDLLDVAYMDVMGVLHHLGWTTPATAHREVMGERWNGWRLTMQAFALIEPQETP